MKNNFNEIRRVMRTHSRHKQFTINVTDVQIEKAITRGLEEGIKAKIAEKLNKEVK